MVGRVKDVICSITTTPKSSGKRNKYGDIVTIGQ